MTIDERLERLSEHQEALTQSVEMLNLRTADLLKATEADAENIRALAQAEGPMPRTFGPSLASPRFMSGD